MLSLLSVSTGFGGQPGVPTYTANQMFWNALWVNSPDTFWYDPVGSPVLQGYDAVVAGAAAGHVPPGLNSSSSITATYFSADHLKSLMALQLVFGSGPEAGNVFNVIDMVEFDSNYHIMSAMTYVPYFMVDPTGQAPFIAAIADAAEAYVDAVVGYHGSANGPATWNALWYNSPDTFWYDPVGSPILQGYDAVVAGAAAGHVPDSAMNTSSVLTVYYSGDPTKALLVLSLCFTFVGGYCFDVVDVVQYNVDSAGAYTIKSAQTYTPAGLQGVNASAPPPAWETNTLNAFNDYLTGIQNYHL